jgi:DNA polymerase-3 subunit gamma/tau
MKQAVAADELERLSNLSRGLSMPTLGKSWQILLKGLGEVQAAPSPQSAVEMVLIRLAYTADLPDPADLIRKLKEQPLDTKTPGGFSAPPRESVSTTVNTRGGNARAQTVLAPQVNAEECQAIHSLADVVSVLEAGGEYLLASQVYQFAHLVKLEEGRLEIRPAEEAPPRLAQDLGAQLSRLSRRRWIVSISGASGQATLAGAKTAAKAKEFANVLQLPVIQEILKVFPEAKLTDIIENKED